jgi:hypothetical protein
VVRCVVFRWGGEIGDGYGLWMDLGSVPKQLPYFESPFRWRLEIGF